MYRVLAALAPACNDQFTALLLPAAITIAPRRAAGSLNRSAGSSLLTGRMGGR